MTRRRTSRLVFFVLGSVHDWRCRDGGMGWRRRPGEILRCLGSPEVGESDSYVVINLHVNG